MTQAAHAHWISNSRNSYAQPVSSDHRQKRLVFRYLFTLLLLTFVCCLFYIWSCSEVISVGYEINREMAVKEHLTEQNKRLVLEIATLKSPVRLESLARNDFKMDLPQKSQILSSVSVTLPPVTEEKTVLAQNASAASSSKPVTPQKTSAATTAARKLALAKPGVGANASKTTSSARSGSASKTVAAKTQALKKEEVKPKKSQATALSAKPATAEKKAPPAPALKKTLTRTSPPLRTTAAKSKSVALSSTPSLP